MFRALPLKAAFAITISAVSLYAQSSGQALFDAKCINCHGKDGKAKTAVAMKMHVADLTSAAVQSMSDAALFESIARGTQHKEYPHAYEYRGMTQSDVNSLVKYIRSLAKQ